MLIHTLEALCPLSGKRLCTKSSKLYLLETGCAVGLSSLSLELPSWPTVMAFALAHWPMLTPEQGKLAIVPPTMLSEWFSRMHNYAEYVGKKLAC